MAASPHPVYILYPEKMDVVLFQKQFDLSIWASLFLVIVFAIMARRGLGQVGELEEPLKWEPPSYEEEQGQRPENENRYPNLSRGERSRRI